MYVVGTSLVKVYKALIRLVSVGTLCPPPDVYVRSFSVPFCTLIKILLYKSSRVIKPGPWSQAKSSSKIMNPTSFNVSSLFDV